MSEYARIEGRAVMDSLTPIFGVYRIYDIGTTHSIEAWGYGMKVETWRKIAKHDDEAGAGLALHVMRVPKSSDPELQLQHSLAVCFWLAEDCRYRVVVLDQMSSEYFCPSRLTQDYAKHAKNLWNDLVSPVIGSHVDSLLTS